MIPDHAQEEQLAGLQELLFRPAFLPAEDRQDIRAYALVDGACDPSIHICLPAFPDPARSLFDGEPGEDLAEVAPWLVELSEHGPTLDWLMREGMGKNWGIFILSSLTMPRLKARLKRVLKVETEDGVSYLFKYYRPQHLNDYLPVLLPDQRRQMFSGVTAFLAEDVHNYGQMILHREEQLATKADLAALGRDLVIRPPHALLKDPIISEVRSS